MTIGGNQRLKEFFKKNDLELDESSSMISFERYGTNAADFYRDLLENSGDK